MQEDIEEIPKPANSPIALPASIMGVGGLSLVSKKASVVFNHQAFSAWPALGFAILALITSTPLFAYYSAKILYYFKVLKADLAHQVKINFPSSISISILIITAPQNGFISEENEFWWVVLGSFHVASTLQLILSLCVMSF